VTYVTLVTIHEFGLSGRGGWGAVSNFDGFLRAHVVKIRPSAGS
jgi:hypothetical protein